MLNLLTAEKSNCAEAKTLDRPGHIIVASDLPGRK